MEMEGNDSAEIASQQLCVVYDPRTGKILHVHQVITLEGASAPKPEKVAARAMELAGKLIAPGISSRRQQMRTLNASPEAFAEPGAKKVDLKRLRVVAAKSRRPAQAD